MDKQQMIIDRSYMLYIQSCYKDNLYDICNKVIHQLLYPGEIQGISQPFTGYLNYIVNKVIDKIKQNMKVESINNLYHDKGFSTRDDYLVSLSDKYNIKINKIRELAEQYGPEEDFNLLIKRLERGI